MEHVAYLSLAATIGVVWATVHFISRAEGQRVFFTHVGRNVSDADRARVRRTRVVNALCASLGVGVVLRSSSQVLLAWAATVLPLIPLAWMLGELGLLTRTAKSQLPPARYVVPLDDPPAWHAFISVPLEIANAAVVLLSSGVFWLLSTSLPMSIPLHFDLAGRPNRWGNPAELWILGGTMLFDLVLLWFIVLMVAKERWALPPENRMQYAQLSTQRRAWIVRMVEWIILGVNGSLGVIWIGVVVGVSHPDLIAPSVLLGMGILALGLLGPMAVYLRRLSRVGDQLRKLGGSEALGTRPDGWRWGGFIYYAPDDPALFVPKQRGIGQTLNFARKGAWMFVFVILLVPLVLALGGSWVAAAR
ncbi:MAG: DUF5808 domain-containing protein [Polyangiaceae bacterium]